MRSAFPCPRRHARYRFLVATILAISAAKSVPVLGADDPIEGHQRDLADVERRVHDLEQGLDTRRARRESLLAELERRERDIASLAGAGHQLAEMIDAQEQTVEDLRGQLAVEQEALSRERAALGGLLRSAYAMGRGDRVRLLLDQEDPDRLSRIMAYYGFVNRFRVRRIEAVARRARNLDRLAQEAEEEKVRLSVLAGKQDETRARLALAQGERSALLTSLEQTIATDAESISNLRAQAGELRRLLEWLEQQAQLLPEAELRQAPLAQLRGRLSWPLTTLSLQSRYGSPKGDGALVWDGVVLETEEGAEVRAVHHGRVAYADWLRGFGLLLIIEHDDDYMTLYGHNQALLKEPGEWVGAGDVIALSGSSGGRSSSGLYFAIRHRGQPLNPEKWCRRKVGVGNASPAPTSWRWNATEFLGSNPNERSADSAFFLGVRGPAIFVGVQIRNWKNGANSLFASLARGIPRKERLGAPLGDRQSWALRPSPLVSVFESIIQ